MKRLAKFELNFSQKANFYKMKAVAYFCILFYLFLCNSRCFTDLSECSDGFTLGVWVFLGSPKQSVGFLISSGGNQRRVINGGFTLFQKPNGVIGASVQIGDPSKTGSGTEWVNHGVFLGENHWAHIAVTWHRDTELKFYINGVLRTTIAAENYSTAHPVDVSSEMHLGKRNHHNDYYANATMDELQIWKREFTATEIRSIAETK